MASQKLVLKTAKGLLGHGGSNQIRGISERRRNPNAVLLSDRSTERHIPQRPQRFKANDLK